MFSPNLSEITGTWTPTLTFATPGNLAVTYSVRDGHFQKVGNKVNWWLTLLTSAFTHTTASGSALITGLPFTTANVSNRYQIGLCVWQGITAAGFTQVNLVARHNTSQLEVFGSGSGVGFVGFTTGNFPTGGTPGFLASGQYTI